MNNLKLHAGLLYSSASLNYEGRALNLDAVIIDTGSASCIFKYSKLEKIGVFLEQNDRIGRIGGIGGVELVFRKRLDSITVGEIVLENFQVDVGDMDYGFEIDGIIGLDFLIESEAILDFKKLNLQRKS